MTQTQTLTAEQILAQRQLVTRALRDDSFPLKYDPEVELDWDYGSAAASSLDIDDDTLDWGEMLDRLAEVMYSDQVLTGLKMRGDIDAFVAVARLRDDDFPTDHTLYQLNSDISTVLTRRYLGLDANTHRWVADAPSAELAAAAIENAEIVR